MTEQSDKNTGCLNDTKRRVVKTAFSLFKLKGYDNVTINEICAETSISKHTFYYHFNSKDEILAAFFIIPQEIRAERIHSIITAENFFEQYWLLMEPIVMFFDEYGAEITKNFFFIKSKRDPKSMKKPENKEKEKLELTILKKAQEAGEIRNQSDCRDLLSLGFHVIISTAAMWSLTHEERPLFHDCRFALETAFDVSPNLRKCPYRKTKST